MDNIYNRVYGRNDLLFYLIAPIISNVVVPNLRNAFIEDPTYEKKNPKHNKFYIYTEIGSANRYLYEREIENMKKHKYYVDNYDEDEKFTIFIFRFPTKFKKDYEIIKEWKFNDVSRAYRDELDKTWKHTNLLDVMEKKYGRIKRKKN